MNKRIDNELYEEFGKVIKYCEEVILEDERLTQRALSSAENLGERFYDAYLNNSRVSLNKRYDNHIMESFHTIYHNMSKEDKNDEKIVSYLQELSEFLVRCDKNTRTYDEEFLSIMNRNYSALAEMNETCRDVVEYSKSAITNREEKYSSMNQRLEQFIELQKSFKQGVSREEIEKQDILNSPFTFSTDAKEGLSMDVFKEDSLNNLSIKQEVEQLQQMKQELEKNREEPQESLSLEGIFR